MVEVYGTITNLRLSKRTKNLNNNSTYFGLSMLLLLFHYANCSIKARCSNKRFLLLLLLNPSSASRETATFCNRMISLWSWPSENLPSSRLCLCEVFGASLELPWTSQFPMPLWFRHQGSFSSTAWHFKQTCPIWINKGYTANSLKNAFQQRILLSLTNLAFPLPSQVSLGKFLTWPDV